MEEEWNKKHIIAQQKLRSDLGSEGTEKQKLIRKKREYMNELGD